MDGEGDASACPSYSLVQWGRRLKSWNCLLEVLRLEVAVPRNDPPSNIVLRFLTVVCSGLLGTGNLDKFRQSIAFAVATARRTLYAIGRGRSQNRYSAHWQWLATGQSFEIHPPDGNYISIYCQANLLSRTLSFKFQDGLQVAKIVPVVCIR